MTRCPICNEPIWWGYVPIADKLVCWQCALEIYAYVKIGGTHYVADNEELRDPDANYVPADRRLAVAGKGL